ncbi:hypothetical protein NDU88_000879 [Pleurodeles waltl]|uniref:Uncharacterized protein n=1 Tax=Pleurodeles waltl TaxID=8319 RepID=A0AAV7KNX9_PLEWA|nr:hypothetical protein NDU88_000879 [Pleurodeles waltl]
MEPSHYEQEKERNPFLLAHNGVFSRSPVLFLINHTDHLAIASSLITWQTPSGPGSAELQLTEPSSCLQPEHRLSHRA